MHLVAAGIVLAATCLAGCSKPEALSPASFEPDASMMARFDGLVVAPGDFDAGHFAEAWSWRIGDDATPILLTAVGDAVFSTADGVFWLDTATAETVRLANGVEDAGDVLDEDGRLRALLVAELEARLGPLGENQIYSMKNPVALGGDYVVNNYLRLDSVDVHYVMTGQLLEQVVDLPDGTPVGPVTID